MIRTPRYDNTAPSNRNGTYALFFLIAEAVKAAPNQELKRADVVELAKAQAYTPAQNRDRMESMCRVHPFQQSHRNGVVYFQWIGGAENE